MMAALSVHADRLSRQCVGGIGGVGGVGGIGGIDGIGGIGGIGGIRGTESVWHSSRRDGFPMRLTFKITLHTQSAAILIYVNRSRHLIVWCFINCSNRQISCCARTSRTCRFETGPRALPPLRTLPPGRLLAGLAQRYVF